MKVINENTLYIVGAGPGNPELLTIKAYKTIEKAQVILYDNLVNKELLDIAPESCIKYYVGKHPYGDYVSQDNINDLIAFYCERYERVVRLKGGDPYLFGRGFEEWAVAKRLGVQVEYIPGISSMQGAGWNNIPLTHRNVAEGVWILTGMKKDGSLSSDLALAAQSSATVVIYMGMRKLAEIARNYVMYGKGDLPAAIIQHATLPQQKSVVCQVQDLLKTSEQHGLGHPAIIVIGEVVNLQYALTLAAMKQDVV
ncbi:uroporphyrinogen-III C-methyltransferase [Sphingobacterium oryzagri]|uniref:uroporphyrinogen-III C-methyltransferase n=1 Tax=Sphingobacterium oryzagri TaxID=3025669 RepID=A0ABY7WIA5_9SPHI|nr:uroporphyrinogen-III C-methyltransferase [Sphingobacterium sp. KACC 22765]WDF68319.1 uroporphyrinogen-III C-methyltransferase [Sphingobacterium sp. KACC 22765]